MENLPAGWVEIGLLQIDSATCAFGDADVLGPSFQADPSASPAMDGPVQDWTERGAPLVACDTREDLPLPLEVSFDQDGRVIAARLTFTTDVDELESKGEGRWRKAGAVSIESGRCLAADPFCSPVPAYRLVFDVVAGMYLVEAFVTGDDCLGLRIRLLREGTGSTDESTSDGSNRAQP